MRITFLGGGTDYPTVFNQHGGAAIYGTIDKFVYVSTLNQPNFVNDKYKFTYRITESVAKLDDLKHPVVRETLRLLNWEEPINISTMASLPGNSGLGSSSAFTACLIQNLFTRLGRITDERTLANLAIEIERGILKEAGGWQDQIATSYGGLRLISFSNNTFEVSENLADLRLSEYMKPRSLLLRVAADRDGLNSARKSQITLAKSTNKENVKKIKHQSLQAWKDLVESKTVSDKFSVLQRAIQTAWNYKREWGSHIVTSSIEEVSKKLELLDIRNYKLVGAGGGGFFLILEDMEKINEVRNSFKSEDLVNFSLSFLGTETKRYEQ